MAYLCSWHRPDLVIVWSHEDVCNALTNVSQNPLVKVFWLVACHSCLDCSVDQPLQTLDLVLLWQHGNVVLEWVWHPQSFVADIGDALVSVPVGVVGEGFVDAVVEVFVVGEDYVAADIVELGAVSAMLPRMGRVKHIQSPLE